MRIDATTPKPWDITLARDAVNGILVYSAEPERTLRSFYRAIGLVDVSNGEKSRQIRTEDLNDFRNEGARELERNSIDYTHFRVPWILRLSGGQ